MKIDAESKYHKVTTLADALKLVRSVHRVYLHVRMDGYLVDDPDHYRQDYFFGAVRLSKTDAVRFLTDAMRHCAKPNLYLPMRVRTSEQAGGIDYKTYTMRPAKTVRTLWIG